MRISRAAAVVVLMFGVATLATAEPTSPPATTQPAATPKVGELAPDFTLSTLDDRSVELSQLTEKGNVVVIVLRGWPGYQCPICTKQVGELVTKAKAFEDRSAPVVLIYPGPADDLKAHAAEFAKGKGLPDNFTFVIDPDYTFTNAYHLRWNVPKETAYPSTFVIDKTGVVRMEMVSKSHGGRSTPAQILAALDKIK